MRILHLLSQTQMTGTETYLQTLATQQISDGHQLWIVSDRLHIDIPGSIKSLPISEKNLKSRKLVFEELSKWILEHKIEIIHCHSRAAVRHGYLLGQKLNLPMVSTLHGQQHFSWSKRFFDTYGELIVVNCENLGTSFVHQFKTRPEKIRLIRNPVNPTTFKATAGTGKKDRIALIGRASGPKGQRLQEVVQQIWPKLCDEFPNLQFDLIVPETQSFPESFKKNLPPRVNLKQQLGGLEKLYSNYDLIIGSGRVAMEAVLSGRSCLALGEVQYCGLVEVESLHEQLKSNFGDIAPGRTVAPIQLEKLLIDLRSALRLPFKEKPLVELRQILADLLDPQEISEDCTDIYHQARFLKHHPKNIPVLMYHKIPTVEPKSPHKIYVLKENFAKHLDFFSRSGFTSLFLSELRDYYLGKKPLHEFPKKPLILTFDDGYEDNLTNALPLLEKYQTKANIFLLADKSIQENTWDMATGEPPYRLMTPEQRQQLSKCKNFEIGSHGLQHLDLTSLDASATLSQLTDSKLLLEKEFAREVISLVYPFGKTNRKIAKLARQAGYFFALNTDTGGISWLQDRWSLFRVNIFPQESRFSLWRKLRPGYRKHFLKTRGK